MRSDTRGPEFGLPILEAFRQKVRGWLSRSSKPRDLKLKVVIGGKAKDCSGMFEIYS
jgi:hypothetical protein